jgi:hypothetical protein
MSGWGDYKIPSIDLRNGFGREYLILLAHCGRIGPIIPTHLGSICG